MKIVTMCRGGNVRSVAAKQILNRYLGHEVIAIGADNTNDETKKLVFDWADRIIVMSPEFLKYIPVIYFMWGKSVVLDVGNDIWGDPFHEDLQMKIVEILNSDPFKSFYNLKNEDIDKQKVLDTIRAYKAKIAARNMGDSSL